MTYNHSMQLTSTKSHLEGGAAPPCHESPLIPLSQKFCQGSTVLCWSMHWVFNTLFHDLVTISGVPLYRFFHLARYYLENLIFISHDVFHIKACLYLLQSFYVWWIFISHSSDGYPIHRSLSRITSRRFIMKDSSLSHSSKWFILLIYLITHLLFILHIT